MKNSSILIAACAVATLSAAPRLSAVTQVNFNSSNQDFAANGSGYTPTTNLLTGRTPTGATSEAVGSIGGINDGSYTVGFAGNGLIYYGNTAYGSKLNSGNVETGGMPSVTISLDTSSAPQGYDLSGLKSLFSWRDTTQSFANQNYKISVSTISAPSVFFDIYTVAYNPFSTSVASSAASLVTLTDLNSGGQATGVGAVRFTFSAGLATDSVAQLGAAIQEIELYGTATSAIPEPASFAQLVGVAGLAAGCVLRRRRVAS